MAGIELIVVGELKFPGLRDVESMYVKRMGAFVPFSLQRVKEGRGGDDGAVRRTESLRILDRIKIDDQVVTLDVAGQTMDSQAFAAWLKKHLVYERRRLVFVIGGFAGVDDALDRRGDFKLSFSPMTFSHDLFRVLFLEQLYRAFTIIHGITYHR